GEIHYERAEPYPRSQWRAIQQQGRERDTSRGKNGGGITWGNSQQGPKPAEKHIGGREEQHLEDAASGLTGTSVGQPERSGNFLGQYPQFTHDVLVHQECYGPRCQFAVRAISPRWHLAPVSQRSMSRRRDTEFNCRCLTSALPLRLVKRHQHEHAPQHDQLSTPVSRR